MRRVVAGALLASAVGCASNPTPQAAAERPWQDVSARLASTHGRGESGRTLSADLGFITGSESDSTIAALLAHRLTLPGRIAVGVLHVPPPPSSPRDWYPAASEFTFGPAIQDSALASLRRLPRVHRVALLPSFVLAERRSVTALREAAARIQVDLAVVYRPSCRLFERTPFIGARSYRAACTLELVVIDVRSGVIPYSGTADRDVVDRRQEGDDDEAGTFSRVATQAAAAAIVAALEGLSASIALVPISPP